MPHANRCACGPRWAQFSLPTMICCALAPGSWPEFICLTPCHFLPSVSPALVQAATAMFRRRAHAHPDRGHPGHPARRRCRGLGPDGFGQTAAFALPLLQRLQAGATPTPRQVREPAGAHARAGGPGRRSGAQPGPAPARARESGRGVWRRLHQPPDDGLRGGADVVVATPGRLLDLVDHNALCSLPA